MARAHSINIDASHNCERCGAPDACDLHAFWVFPGRLVKLDLVYDPLDIICERFIDCRIFPKIGSGLYYGDALGGLHSAVPKIRRCGCGLAVLKSDGVSLKWGCRYALPGTVRTVPRAELRVLYLVTLMADQGASIEFVTDNKANCNKFNKGRGSCMLSTNCDLNKHKS